MGGPCQLIEQVQRKSRWFGSANIQLLKKDMVGDGLAPKTTWFFWTMMDNPKFNSAYSSRPSSVFCDASEVFAIGSALLQTDEDGQDCVIALSPGS